ncbi:MAG: LEA type 2 family protein [Bacteroidetes bacterium]|nr:LEA type 2 family protein [Bacteroidota bacterium]
MPIKFSPLLFVFFGFCIIASSCQEPKELEYRDFKNLSVPKLGFSTSTFTVDLVYFNPNNFGLQLRRTDLDIYIDSNYLGHTTQEFQITIPRKGEFTIPLSIDVDMKNAYKNAMPALLGKEVLVKVIGKVKVGKANVYKSFNVNYQGMQKFSL